MHLVLTACTSRKKAQPSADLHARALAWGPLSNVAADWASRLRDSSTHRPASELYGGRSFQEAVSAARRANAKLGIVSAGLGLVRSDDMVPAYSLTTVVGSSDTVFARISHRASVSDWWSAISQASPFARVLPALIRETPGLVLVALSQTYLSMIRADLDGLPTEDQRRLRILTAAPRCGLAPALQPLHMPYDGRLDGPDSPLRGTKSDFASRAACHFVQNVLLEQPEASPEAHADLVERTLASWRVPHIPPRARYDDASLRRIIADYWDEGQGQSSKLLRILRDDLKIACEQGRFASLMNEVRATRKLAA